MPHLKKAELIEGVVYMAAALRLSSHGEPHGLIMTWLGTYRAFTPGIILGNNVTVRLDFENEPQPDAVLLLPGRQAIINAEDYLEGAPELVVEIAASSAAIDLHDKKRAYQRNGVRDYIVWRTLEHQLDWFVLTPKGYSLQAPNPQGILHSEAFPGLWLAVDALLATDMPTVLSTLQQGLRSAEYQAFQQSLRAASD